MKNSIINDLKLYHLSSKRPFHDCLISVIKCNIFLYMSKASEGFVATGAPGNITSTNSLKFESIRSGFL